MFPPPPFGTPARRSLCEAIEQGVYAVGLCSIVIRYPLLLQSLVVEDSGKAGVLP